MKRVGNLIPKIADMDNLRLAYYKAKLGKEAKPDVREYGSNLPQNLLLLQQQIQTGNVVVGNYHLFNIYDPKKRQICAAPFAQRVLHHALMNVCHPVFEQFQIYHSYATRINKGTHKAIAKAQQHQAHYQYYLKMDVRKYFDSIDHTILLQLLHRQFKDPLLLHIFTQIIASYWVSPHKGLPIGNLTSQYFANHYLGITDHHIKSQLNLPAYVRYMDDFVVWHNNPHQLSAIAQNISTQLHKTLQLQLKTKTQNTCVYGLSFLGYRLFPHQTRLTARSKKRYLSKMIALNNSLQNAKISQAQFGQQATCLHNFVRPTGFTTNKGQ